MGMVKITETSNLGTTAAAMAGKIVYESIKENAELCESFGVDFKEDNTMGNSTSLYTTVLAKAIYYKSYDKFQKYFDIVVNLTPADLGMPEGAGAYKIPKILGTTAVKLSSGEAVEYTNKNKAELILETDTYGVGTRINRRLLKRGAKGFVNKLLTAASDGVLRAVSADLVNGMVAGAAAANTLALGISIDAIADSVKNVVDSKDANNILFGFVPDTVALTTLGKNVLTKSTDYKTIFGYGQNNIPGGELKTQYTVYDGMKMVPIELVTTQKAAKDVHAMVFDSQHYMAHLKETEMDTFDGRIPGTPGDQEIIHAMDCGFVIINAEACSVITAA